MHYTIIDGYTDEPSGLGVPPYLGVYPRYVLGKLLVDDPNATFSYLTIDDLRADAKGLSKEKAEQLKYEIKSNTSIYTLTTNEVRKTIAKTDVLVCILGVQTPGKYLSAHPATLAEMIRLTKSYKMRKVLTGPAVSEYGTQVQGGKKAEQLSDMNLDDYALVQEDSFSDYEVLREISIKGALLVEQVPQPCIAEIEISQGCWRKKNCSFCTEPLRMDMGAFRKIQDIVDEMKALHDHGVKRFRLGRATCVYSYMMSDPDAIESLFKAIWKACPHIEVLHIDNVRPELVCTAKGELITQHIVKYCTEGNIAAFGCETFDVEVARKNNLNSFPDKSMEAIRVLNKYGAERGKNGVPKFLPGINIIFGLEGESKKTHEANMHYLKQILDENLLIRRINIRQAVSYPGTALHAGVGSKFLRKNKKYYFKWRDEIRQQIDVPMLERLYPKGQILTEVFTEIYDGNNTFARQFGSYPIVMGIKKRVPLRQFINVKVVGYMKRSLIVEPID